MRLRAAMLLIPLGVACTHGQREPVPTPPASALGSAVVQGLCARPERVRAGLGPCTLRDLPPTPPALPGEDRLPMR